MLNCFIKINVSVDNNIRFGYNITCVARCDNMSRIGQEVKTSPSHGGIWGSIPQCGTNPKYQVVQLCITLASRK